MGLRGRRCAREGIRRVLLQRGELHAVVMVGKAAADARGEAAMANLPAYANCCRC